MLSTTKKIKTSGLFERWLEIERATGRPMTDILDEINAACGTRYRHNWPSVMAERGYSLDRLPTAARRYMLRKVLPAELESLGVKITGKLVNEIVVRLT